LRRWLGRRLGGWVGGCFVGAGSMPPKHEQAQPEDGASPVQRADGGLQVIRGQALGVAAVFHACGGGQALRFTACLSAVITVRHTGAAAVSRP
jgi:hypothetical protein